MEEIIINGKALYTPKGAAREYVAVVCNFYRGCPYQCRYCYNRHGMTAKVMGLDHALLNDKFTSVSSRPKKYRELTGEEYAYMCFLQEVEKWQNYLRKTGIFFSFSTDPFCDECFDLTWHCMCTAVKAYSIPVKVLTKNADFIDDGVFFSWMMTLLEEDRKKVAFGFTLTGRDDMEPGASTNQERIASMCRLKELGFRTWASIEPIIDFNSSLRVIKDSLKFCDHYRIGLRSGVSKSYYSDDELASFVSELSVIHVENDCTMYIKDSIRKRYYNQDVIDFISVPQKYNIFEHD